MTVVLAATGAGGGTQVSEEMSEVGGEEQKDGFVSAEFRSKGVIAGKTFHPVREVALPNSADKVDTAS